MKGIDRLTVDIDFRGTGDVLADLIAYTENIDQPLFARIKIDRKLYDMSVHKETFLFGELAAYLEAITQQVK